MYARVSFYEMGSASRDDVVRAFEHSRAGIERMAGNQGAMVLVAPGGAKAMTITFWESDDALRESEQQAVALRQESAGGAGLTISGVEPYEVALLFGLQNVTQT